MTRTTAEITCTVDGNVQQVAAICQVLKSQEMNIRKIEFLARQTQPNTHYLHLELEYNTDAQDQVSVLSHLQQSLQNSVVALHQTNP